MGKDARMGGSQRRRRGMARLAGTTSHLHSWMVGARVAWRRGAAAVAWFIRGALGGHLARLRSLLCVRCSEPGPGPRRATQAWPQAKLTSNMDHHTTEGGSKK